MIGSVQRVAFLLTLAATAASADVVRILDDPREAVQVRVDLIQQAQTEVDAVYFLARNDRITLAALALLESIDLHVRNAWKAEERVPRDRSFGLWAARLILPLIENQL